MNSSQDNQKYGDSAADTPAKQAAEGVGNGAEASACAPSGNRNTDKDLLRERFEASFARYDDVAHTQKEICSSLAAELAAIPADSVSHIFEFGAGTGFLTRHMAEKFPHAEWVLNDLTPVAEQFLLRYVDASRISWLWGDAEKVEFPGDVDLIASSCTVQWFTDMPAFAARAARATNPGGWLALTTFGVDNFREIRATTGEGLDYLTTERLEEILAGAGYEVVCLRDYHVQLLFEDPSSVLKHIKATGVNSVKKASWGHDRFMRFDADYRRMFSAEGGGVTLTFHPVILLARLK